MSSRRRYEVYDDTQYTRSGAGRNEERHSQFPYGGHHTENSFSGAPVEHYQNPYGDRTHELDVSPPGSSLLESMFPSPWGFQRSDQQMQRRMPEGSLFNDGMFGMMQGMMSSMDRMFDEMASSSMMTSRQFQSSGGGDGHSNGTFVYESRTRTVGPDGVVREETVRTTPGTDGRPETRRTVREGNDITEMPPEYGANSFNVMGNMDMPRIMGDNNDNGRNSGEPEVIVEELDEDGNVIATNNSRTSRSVASRAYAERNHNQSHEEYAPHGEENDTGHRSWWQNRYRRWRNHSS